MNALPAAYDDWPAIHRRLKRADPATSAPGRYDFGKDCRIPSEHRRHTQAPQRVTSPLCTNSSTLSHSGGDVRARHQPRRSRASSVSRVCTQRGGGAMNAVQRELIDGQAVEDALLSTSRPRSSSESSALERRPEDRTIPALITRSPIFPARRVIGQRLVGIGAAAGCGSLEPEPHGGHAQPAQPPRPVLAIFRAPAGRAHTTARAGAAGSARSNAPRRRRSSAGESSAQVDRAAPARSLRRAAAR
jgi:hypothetical protein